ncbi:metal-binding protein, partial [Mesorhizobium sp. USDA-HM6]
MDRNGSFPAKTADLSSEPDDALAGVTVIVCSSCRDGTG